MILWPRRSSFQFDLLKYLCINLILCMILWFWVAMQLSSKRKKIHLHKSMSAMRHCQSMCIIKCEIFKFFNLKKKYERNQTKLKRNALLKMFINKKYIHHIRKLLKTLTTVKRQRYLPSHYCQFYFQNFHLLCCHLWYSQ